VQTSLHWKSNNCYILRACVCSSRHPARIAHSPYCHLRPVRLFHIPPHYLRNCTIFTK